MKQYDVVELIADVERTSDGIQGMWNTAHALSVLNAKAKEGWEFKFLIPDEKGRCIIERNVDSLSAMDTATMAHYDKNKKDMENILEVLKSLNIQMMCANAKKWWQFWK